MDHLTDSEVDLVARARLQRDALEVTMEMPELSEHMTVCGRCTRRVLDRRAVLSVEERLARGQEGEK